MPNHLIPPWTKEQDELLRQHYSTSPREVLDQLFPHRTPSALTHRASRLKLEPRRNKYKPRGTQRGHRLSREEYIEQRSNGRKDAYKKAISTDYRMHFVSDARRRAVDKKIECSITKEDIVIPEYCPLLGVKLQKAQGYPSDNSPSLDRIDVSKGYTKDNIWIISYRANRIKNNATLLELKMITYSLEKVLQSNAN